MKTTWKIERLGHIFQIKPPKNEAKTYLKNDDLVSFVPMEDLGILTKDFTVSKERYLKEVSGSYTYFSDNDVLLAKITPCFENGKMGIARNLKNGVGFGSSEYIVFRSNGKVISNYLFYFLSADQFRQEGKKRMSGAVGHKRVSKDFIENYLMPFPESLSEQQHIVAILDKAFAAIDKAKENAKKNHQNARELFDSSLQKTFDNPKEKWEEKRLADLCTIKHGYAFKSKDFKTDFNGDGPIVLTPGNFSEHARLFFNEKNTKRYTEKCSKEFNFNIGDLVVVMTDLSSQMKILGKPAIIEEKNILHNQRIGRFIFNDNSLNKTYLFYYLQTISYLKTIKETATGTMVKHTAPTRILSNTISYPSLSEQNSIVTNLNMLSLEVNKLENIYKKKLINLEKLKASILQKAFNGELTNSNIDIDMEVQA